MTLTLTRDLMPFGLKLSTGGNEAFEYVVLKRHEPPALTIHLLHPVGGAVTGTAYLKREGESWFVIGSWKLGGGTSSYPQHFGCKINEVACVRVGEEYVAWSGHLNMKKFVTLGKPISRVGVCRDETVIINAIDLCCTSAHGRIASIITGVFHAKMVMMQGRRLDVLSSSLSYRISCTISDPASVGAMFAHPARNACTTLEVKSTTDIDIMYVAQVLAAKPPFLRQLHFLRGDQWHSPQWKTLFEAAVESPYLERIVFVDDDVNAELLLQLFPLASNNDIHPPLAVTFYGGRSVSLSRRTGIVSVKQAFPIYRAVETTPVVYLKFFGVRVPVRRCCAVAFSSFLADLLEPMLSRERHEGKNNNVTTSDATDNRNSTVVTEAESGPRDTFAPRNDASSSPPAAEGDVEIPIPETYSNADGDEESENRWSTVDVRLAALWMNEYADDEVHQILMNSNDPPYHVSLVGQHFFDEHINKS